MALGRIVTSGATQYDADVCVIGSGLAGAIVALECVRAGRTVLMLEAGRPKRGRGAHIRLTERLFRSHNTPRMRLWLRNARYDRRDHKSAGGRKYDLSRLAVIARGGATLGWTGYSYRMQPEDFRLKTLAGRGVDWPLSYDDLEIHYRRAEQTLRAQGDHRDPGHPPRTGPFPVAPSGYGQRDEAFVNVMQTAGHSVMHHNATLASDGGPFSADEILNRLETRGGFRLLTGVVARRLITDGHRVTAVEASKSGKVADVMIEASAVAVCAGGIESPKLLMASASPQHPNGLGNTGGHLGRNLVSHAGVLVGGSVPGRPAFPGPIAPTAASRYHDSQAEQRLGKYLVLWRPRPKGPMVFNAIVEQHPDASSHIQLGSSTDRFGLPGTVVHFEQSPAHRERVSEIASRLRSLADQAGIPVTIDSNYVHAHPMCATRMSAEEADGVVDVDLRIHGFDNVFVCSSSSFATGGAAHSTMTIAALAHRLGSLLAARTSAA